MTTHNYIGWEVDAHTEAAHRIGDEFKGGTVIEGTSDSDRNVLILVVRYPAEVE